MTFDSSLLELMQDTVTIEPFAAESSARVITFGSAVTYRCVIERGRRRVIGKDGRETMSTAQIMIPDRVNVDIRSRLTLPSSFVPQQPPILGIEHSPVGLGIDNTVVLA